MRLIAVMLVLALAAVGVVLWFASAPVASPPSANAASQDAGLEAANCGTTEPQLRYVESADRSASETQAPTQPDEQPSIEEAGPAPVGLDFRWKYGRNARAELIERLTQLESTVQRDFDIALAACWKTEGGYVQHEIAANDGRPIDEIVRSLSNERELCGSRIVVDAGNGGTLALRAKAVDIACLARASHAELYALADERDWLREFVGGLPPEDP